MNKIFTIKELFIRPIVNNKIAFFASKVKKVAKEVVDKQSPKTIEKSPISTTVDAKKQSPKKIKDTHEHKVVHEENTHKTDSSAWKVDIINNPQMIGKLPLTTPVFLNNFPKKIEGTVDYYEGYIMSNRTLEKSREIMLNEHKYNCRNYAPLPVVLKEGHGSIVEDVDGFKYLDCLMGYASVNLGHGNDRIHKVITSQISKLYMTARAFYNDKLHETAKLLCETFGKEKVCFANGGVEGVETALKLARRWAYRVKKVEDNKAKIIFAKGNFMGRTITVCGASEDKGRYLQFGPYVQDAFHLVPYNDVKSIQDLLESDPNICAVFLEPIQGEGGIVIPDNDYLSKVYDLCKKHNVLYIDDEIQAGLGRSGKLLACEYSLKERKPDMIILAKSITNGYYPVSCVLADKVIMDGIGPGEHGSTFSGNPLGMSIATAAIKELIADQGKVIKNSFDIGAKICYFLLSLNCPLVKEVRGRGLFIGIEFHHDIPIEVSDIVLFLMEKGLITKQTHKYNIRLTPPINIGFKEAEAIYHIFKSVLGSISSQVQYFGKEQATHNFLMTASLKKECDEYLMQNHEVVYKTKNPKQESYKLSIMNKIDLMSEKHHDSSFKSIVNEDSALLDSFNGSKKH